MKREVCDDCHAETIQDGQEHCAECGGKIVELDFCEDCGYAVAECDCDEIDLPK